VEEESTIGELDLNSHLDQNKDEDIATRWETTYADDPMSAGALR
jgi:hypothetical protein